MPRAKRGVDHRDVVLHPVGDDPLEGLLIAGIGDVLVVVHPEGDEASAGGNSLVFRTVKRVAVADGDSRQAGAVAVGVHRVGIVGDEVVSAQVFALKSGMVVVLAGVDEDDRLPRAVVLRIIGDGQILIDKLGNGAPRGGGEQRAAFQRFQIESLAVDRTIIKHSYRTRALRLKNGLWKTLCEPNRSLRAVALCHNA